MYNSRDEYAAQYWSDFENGDLDYDPWTETYEDYSWTPDTSAPDECSYCYSQGEIVKLDINGCPSCNADIQRHLDRCTTDF